jgi:hypothetical protein
MLSVIVEDVKMQELTFDDVKMQELNFEEVNEVGAGLGFSEAGLAIMGLGFVGGPATAAFGLIVGGSALYLGYWQDRMIR